MSSNCDAFNNPGDSVHPSALTFPMKLRSLFLLGAIIICLLAAALQKYAAALPLKIDDPSSPAHLRLEVSAKPTDGRLHAQLAIALLKPLEEVAPNTDESSLYGPDFTLHHPNVAEARKHTDLAIKHAPTVLETQIASTMTLMAEGKGEDAIQPGRRVVDLAPKSADSHILLARAHLLAGCAQGCECRESLRKEKKEERKQGRKSALEAREEEAKKSSERQSATPAARKAAVKDRSTLRAGAMWRIMEAGRILQTATSSEPENAYAKRLAKESKKLVTLDAHKVLTTEQVMSYAQCHYFFGQELEGQPCDKRRYKYE